MDGSLGVGVREDIATSDECISTSLHECGSSGGIHPSIDLDEGAETTLSDELLETSYLVHGAGDELLPSEAWIDTHQQYHV